MRAKHITLIVIALFLLGGSALAMSSINYRADWIVPLTGAGGGAVSSTNYAADFTVGQTVSGVASSNDYAVGLGYWHGIVETSLSGANLSLSIIDLPDPVTTGGSLTYTITIINNGPDDASGVTLVNTLPPEVIFGTATPSQGSGCVGSSPIICNLGDLGDSATATVVIIVTAPETETTLTNSAIATSSQIDPDTANNAATAYTEVETTDTEENIYLPVILKP